MIQTNLLRTLSPGLTRADDSDDWRTKAACSDDFVNADWWHPSGTTGEALLNTEEAKRICRGCEVKQVCLEWAYSDPQMQGIAGGYTLRERVNLKRRRTNRRPLTPEQDACGTTVGYSRHKAAEEPPCERCVEARRTSERERDRQRDRSGRRKQA